MSEPVKRHWPTTCTVQDEPVKRYEPTAHTVQDEHGFYGSAVIMDQSAFGLYMLHSVYDRDIKALKEEHKRFRVSHVEVVAEMTAVIDQQAKTIEWLRHLLGMAKATMDAQEPRGPDDVRLSMYLDDALENSQPQGGKT